jgi:N-succinyldiaminopimelate aminotransferase
MRVIKLMNMTYTNLKRKGSGELLNNNLNYLQPYPFERLNTLKAGITPPHNLKHIALSIGEPTHSAPEFVKRILTDSVADIACYPTTRGKLELREAISNWIENRFSLKTASINPEENVLPVCGTREAIFAFTQACISPALAPDRPLVVTLNPFYQIYEGAAILASADLHFLSCDANQNFTPNFSEVPTGIWQRCELLQLCSPGNPTGALISPEQMTELIQLADKYDFVISSDECYSEVYLDESNPPVGLLEVCNQIGRDNYSRCVVFHSLSKRSNLPGLRSGFIAGDKKIIESFSKYRTYHGCSMAIPVQNASAAAWRDESHTIENRSQYRKKFAAVTEILKDCLNFPEPEASFYLWPETPIDDVEFAKELFTQQNVSLVPGQFLSRPTTMGDPGKNRVRIALVASTDDCVEAALRIKKFVESLGGENNI